jgi:hypothetical protein
MSFFDVVMNVVPRQKNAADGVSNCAADKKMPSKIPFIESLLVERLPTAIS